MKKILVHRDHGSHSNHSQILANSEYQIILTDQTCHLPCLSITSLEIAVTNDLTKKTHCWSPTKNSDSKKCCDVKSYKLNRTLVGCDIRGGFGDWLGDSASDVSVPLAWLLPGAPLLPVISATTTVVIPTTINVKHPPRTIAIFPILRNLLCSTLVVF